LWHETLIFAGPNRRRDDTELAIAWGFSADNVVGETNGACGVDWLGDQPCGVLMVEKMVWLIW
jgi:hypothetical protein